jgi:uncharacterized protein YndB with AHSA1/START domain/DNA-binding transcriptional ArsR family regulator
MDAVFKALSDPTRRSLLDELFERDGQTLSALEQRLPMTRFGVMKHLRVLEEAGLVVTRRRGREKLHFLNPVPIRLVHDRWVSKYAEPWAARLGELKTRLEQTMEKVFEIYIRTTPERLWEAITDPEMRSKYTFGVRVDSEWTPGSRYQGNHPAAPAALLEGENLEVDPPKRLVQSYMAMWSEDVQRAGTSRVTWEIEPVGDSCRLLVTHDQLPEDANEQIYGGWPQILSGLKTLLETGETLTTPAPFGTRKRPHRRLDSSAGPGEGPSVVSHQSGSSRPAVALVSSGLTADDLQAVLAGVHACVAAVDKRANAAVAHGARDW